MSNYKAWDLYSLGKRIIEWRARAKRAAIMQQRRSYEGELAKMADEFDRKFFTGPYFPPDNVTGLRSLVSADAERGAGRPHSHNAGGGA